MRIGRRESTLIKSQKGGSKTKKPTKARRNKKVNDPKGAGAAREFKNTPTSSRLRNLLQSDVIGDAQSNASKAALPTFLLTNRKKALDELVANCPLGETEEVKSDRAKVDGAARKLGLRISGQNKGGWKLKGMRTPLFYH